MFSILQASLMIKCSEIMKGLFLFTENFLHYCNLQISAKDSWVSLLVWFHHFSGSNLIKRTLQKNLWMWYDKSKEKNWGRSCSTSRSQTNAETLAAINSAKKFRNDRQRKTTSKHRALRRVTGCAKCGRIARDRKLMKYTEYSLLFSSPAPLMFLSITNEKMGCT